MKIFFYSLKTFEQSYLLTANNNRYETGSTAEALSVKTVAASEGYDVVCVFVGDDVTAPVLTGLKANGVRFIAIRAAGYDNVDIDKAEQLGITVANIPAYSPYAVAEHTIAMILALNRKLIRSSKQVHEYDFTLDGLIGFDLHDKTVGIIGTGKIGSVVAKILHGFGCRLLAYDISQDQELKRKYNVSYVSLDLLCSTADIITIHTPLNESTRYFIDRQLLHQMKEGVMLINTSRGALIHTAELISFIEKGIIGYFGMDVYEKEQGVFFYDHSVKGVDDEMLRKLMTMPNVLITPHQAFATRDALSNIAASTFYNIECWSNNLQSRNELPQKFIETGIYEEEEEL